MGSAEGLQDEETMAATALAALLEHMTRACRGYGLDTLTPQELADVARINAATRRRLGRDTLGTA